MAECHRADILVTCSDADLLDKRVIVLSRLSPHGKKLTDGSYALFRDESLEGLFRFWANPSNVRS